MIRLDANYILRYLINDNEKMAIVAEKAILTQDVFISNEVLAEVVYVLNGVYGLSKEEISLGLLKLINLNNISCLDKNIVINALEIFGKKRLDFVDCLLCVYSTNDEVLTFDKKLLKCIEKK